ncbi:MAG: NACHT domain-containing protein [Verrucomicrobiaceae bacterium]|nr:MAG: NACHT domain-containing protein [Verrucomicrobiaceae bacterium]
MLPFEELSWDIFEYATLRIAKLDGDVEYAARLGRQGQKQHGIDLFVLGTDGMYRSWQSKRWKAFSSASVREAVKVFRSGKWYDRSSTFVLCVSCELADEKVQAEIELQRQLLAADGKKFIPMDKMQLSERCKNSPELVDDLFGRSWVSAFIGPDAIKAMSGRLSSTEVQAARDFLLREYHARFRTLDASAHLSDAAHCRTDFRHRVVRPDGLIDGNEELEQVGRPRVDRQTAKTVGRQGPSKLTSSEDVWDNDDIEMDLDAPQSARIDLDEFLLTSNRTLLIGDAGSGKSTLLRSLALDLLSKPSVFPLTRERLSGSIPILIPFSFWVRQSEDRGAALTIDDVVRLFFGSALVDAGATVDILIKLLRDTRCVVLLDGLDEFTNSTAGRTILQIVETFIEHTQTKVIATGRPSGVKVLGGCMGWRRARLLELSPKQQRKVAAEWWADFFDANGAQAATPNRWLSRFFDQLVRTGNLARIAGAPLILVGCLIVALKRGGALPRDSFGIFDELLDILVLIQPNRRGLEALDTKPRSTFSDDDRPLDCLSVLAFSMIMRGQSMGIERTHARKIILQYLTSSDVGWLLEKAGAGADDLIGVSADTTGLIVERGPGEIGFLHASLRDHAAGRYLASKPFSEILDFIRQHSADAPWHQVILSALHHVRRPTELAKAIEEIERQAHTAKNALLLGTKAVGSFGHRSPAVSARLVDQVKNEIEFGSSLQTRAALTEELLNARSDGPAFTKLMEHLPNWIPSPTDYLEAYLKAISAWPPSIELRDFLISAMEDDVATNRRAAAEAFASVFGNDGVAKVALLDKLTTADNATGYAAKLLALVRGWPGHEGMDELLARCIDEPEKQLEAVAATAMFDRGGRSDELRDRLLEMSSDYHLHHSYREGVCRCVVEGWCDDPELRGEALSRLTQGNSRLDYDLAEDIILGGATLNSAEIHWLTDKLGNRHMMVRSARHELGRLTHLATLHPEISEALERWMERAEKHSEYEVAHLAQFSKSPASLERLLQMLESSKRFLFWPVWALIEGWGVQDDRVGPALRSLLERAPKDWDSFAEYIPEIVADKVQARSKLLELCTTEGISRFDFVVRGLAKVARPDDDEVVQSLLRAMREPRKRHFGIIDLIRTFGTHPQVRDFALELLAGREPPLAAIAQHCGHDPNVRNRLLTSVRPLPASLRNAIARQVLEHPQSNIFAHVTDQFDREAHLDTRIRLAIAHAEAAKSDPAIAAIRGEEFFELLHVVGPDYPDRRMTGFVGLVALNQVAKFAKAFPDASAFDAKLEIFGHHKKSDAALAYIAERWSEVQSGLGPDWAVRLKFDEEKSRTWDVLAPHIWRSEELLDGMIEFCRADNSLVGASTLAALARARPSSTLLRAVCERILFGQREGYSDNLDATKARLQAVVLLIDQFPSLDGLEQRFQQAGARVEIFFDVFQALIGSRQSELQARFVEMQGSRIGSWAQYVAIVSGLPAEVFCLRLQAFLESRAGGPWDFTSLARRIVVERLSREPGLAPQLLAMLMKDVSPNAVVGIAEAYVAAWGLDAELEGVCKSIIARESVPSSHPRFARSLMTDQVRPLRSLLSELIETG